MDVLIADPGGRGQALAHKVAESSLVDEIFMAPGNPGSEDFAVNTGISAHDIEGQVDLTRRNKRIGLVILSADETLAMGGVDRFQDEFRGRDLYVWGPTAAAHQIESSKSYAKRIMAARGVPTADYELVYDPDDPIGYGLQQRFPLFAKMDGLYAGKGVGKTNSMPELRRMLRDYQAKGRLDQATPVLIEEGLTGIEISLQAFCDGTNYQMVPFAMKDYKTIYDGDTGPMTGGMAVVGPIPGITQNDIDLFGERYVAPVLAELAAQGRSFTGMLYPGLRGWKVLEYNGRPGDAETQVWATQMLSDIVEVMIASCEGKLAELPPIQWRNTATACIVLAAKGYPIEAEKGAVIRGLDQPLPEGTHLLHAGTRRVDQEVVVDGGRVLNVMSVGGPGEGLESVIARGYEAADLIAFEGKQRRSDIGLDVSGLDFLEYVTGARQNNWQ